MKGYAYPRNLKLLLAAVASALPAIYPRSSLGQTIRYTGTGSTTWAVGGPTNWLVDSTNTATTYSNGDDVIFDDGGNSSVVVNTNVSPNSITFDNFSLAYTLSGTGSISGSGSLQIDGFSRVILNNTGTNTYTGGTFLNYGDLRISQTTVLPAAGPVMVNSGLLELSSKTHTLTGTVTLNEGYAGYGNIVNNGSGFVVAGGLADQNWTGTGGLVKNFSNTSVLAGNDNYGSTTINAGVLQVGYYSTVGSISGPVVDIGTLQFARSDSISFADTISGSGGVAQIGGGTLTLQAANSFSGGESVTQSTLVLDYTNENSNRISTAGALTLNGGTLNILGNASSSFTQSAGTLAIGAGFSSIKNVSGNTTLALGKMNRAAGGVVAFSNSSIGQITTTQGLTDGILGGWALWGNSDWATTSSNVIGAFTGYTTQNNAGSWGTNQVLTDTTGGYSGTIGSNLSVGAIRFNTPAASAVSIASGATLTIGTGGILVTPGAGPNNLSIAGSGTLAASELIVNQNDSNGTLTISASSGFRSLTKTGPGTLVLNGNDSTASGTYNIFGGTLQLGPSFSQTTARAINVAAGATFYAGNASNVYDANATVSGNGIIAGSISLQNAINPGSATGKPGQLTFSGTIAPDASAGFWAFGSATTPGTYNCDINNATGTAGASSGWDLISAGSIGLSGSAGAGSLNLNVSSNKLYIKNFDPSHSYSWPILTETGGGTTLPTVTVQSVAIANPTRGIFSIANSGSNVNLTYTPLTAAQEQSAATSLYNALDFTQPGLSSTKLQHQYQTGQYEAFLSGYRNIFLSRMAGFSSTYPGASTAVSDAGASLQWLLNNPTVTQQTLIAQSNAQTYFINPVSGAVHTNVAGAVYNGLQQSEVDLDPVEFTMALNWVGATPAGGGSSALQTMANLALPVKANGLETLVGNQLLSSAASLVVFSQAFSDFKNVSQVYNNNAYGLGYWTYQGERTYRDPFALSSSTGQFNSDGTGLEQGNYQFFTPGYILGMVEALGSGTQTTNVYTANDPAWLTTCAETVGFESERFSLMIYYPTGGRVGLGTQPPIPGDGSGSRALGGNLSDLGDTVSETLAKYCQNPTTYASYKPTYTSFTFPAGGYSIMQDGWTNQARWTYLNNRNNLLAGGHVDGASNAIQFQALGRTLLTDESSGNCIDSYQLNTVGVDGLSQAQSPLPRIQVPNRAPLPNRFHATPFSNGIEFSEGSYSLGYEKLDWNYSTGQEVYSGSLQDVGLTHQRQVNFFKGLGVDLVIDRMNPVDSNNHTYSINWNFPRTFGSGEVVANNGSQSFYTTSATGANLYINTFGPQVSENVYYGQDHLTGINGPSQRGLTPGGGDFYTTNLATYVPFNSASGTWSGTGPQVVLSLLSPVNGTTNPITSSSDSRSTSTIAAMDATYTNGSLVSADVAKTGVAAINNWGFATTAESLVLGSTDQKANIEGMVLNATTLSFNGTSLRSQIPVRDAEFQITSSGSVTGWSEVSTPLDFQWASTAVGTMQTSANTSIQYGSFGTPWVGATGGAFNSSSNWYGGVVPAAGVGANFNIGLGASGTITLSAPITVGGLNFDNPNASYTVGTGTGPAITLDNSTSAGDTAAAITNRGGSHTVAAPLIFSGGDVALFSSETSGGVLNVSGNISGTANNIFKFGSGTIELSGNNSFTGNTYLCGGVLKISSDAALGDSTNQVSFGGATAGTLEFAGTTTSSRTFVCSGWDAWNYMQVDPGVTATLVHGISQGGINKVGSGTLVLGNCDPAGYGTINISAGMVQFGSGGSGSGSWAGSFNNNASLAFNRSDAFAVSNVIYGNGQLHDLGSGTMTLNSALSGSSSLYMDGSGTLIAASTSAGNTYTGDIFLNNGAVQFNALNNVGGNSSSQYIHFQGGTLNYVGTSAIAPTQTLNPTGNGTLAVNVSAPSTSYINITNAAQLNGSGTLNLSGNGAVLFKYAGDEPNFTGTLNLFGTYANGNAQLYSNSMSSAVVNVGSLSTLAATGTVTFAELTGSGTVGSIDGQAAANLIVGDSGTFTYSGTFQNTAIGGKLGAIASLTKQGSGAMTVDTNPNGTAGFNLAINAGKIQLANDNVLPSGTLMTIATGALFDLRGKAQTLSYLGGTGGISIGTGGLLTVNNGISDVYAGGMGGTLGSFAKTGSGSLSITGKLIYTGSTTLSGGTLTIDESSSGQPIAALSGSGTINIGSSGMLHLLTVAGGTGAGGGTVSMLSSSAALYVGSGNSHPFNLELNGAVQSVASLVFAGIAQPVGYYGSSAFFADTGFQPASASTESYFSGDGGFIVTSSAAAVTSVPEPSAVGLVSVIGVAALTQRRRRRNGATRVRVA